MEKVDQIREKLYDLYPDTVDHIWKFLAESKPTTFRINTIKADEKTIRDRLRAEGFLFTSGPLPNSYILIEKGVKRLSETEAFNTGELYIQSLESMLPVFILNPTEDEAILDLCAAPGSKTTQLAAVANNKAHIIAVEKDAKRFRLLQDIVHTSGATSIKPILDDGFRLEQRHAEYHEHFDAAIVDVPCSNEAYINPLDERSITWWTSKRYKDYAGIQKGLLISAYRMLKPGGRLVYSTCTFDIHENEMIIDWLLDKYPDAVVEPITLPISNTTPGRVEWKGKQLSNAVTKTVRIVPDGQFGAFFVAKIRKVNDL